MNAMDTQSSKSRQKSPMEPWLKAALWVTGSLLAILLLVVAAASIVTSMMTSERLTRYFNKYASEYLNADVSAKRIEFTFWSTFPRFCLEMDSIQINSRALKCLPKEVRAQLPANADSLCTIRHLSGSLETLKAIHNKWHFHEVKIQGASLNLVKANDSIANWDILPEKTTRKDVPYFTVERAEITSVEPVSYFSNGSIAQGNGKFKSLVIERSDSSLNDYRVKLQGDLSAEVEDFQVLRDRPFQVEGDVKVAFEPLKVNFSDFLLDIQGIGSIRLGMEVGEASRINLLNCKIDSFDLMALWEYVSQRYFPAFKEAVSTLTLESDISLTQPYAFDSAGHPDFNVNVSKLHIGGNDFDMTASADISDILGTPSVKSNMVGEVDLSLLQHYIPALTGWNLRGRADANLDMAFAMRVGESIDFSNVDLKGVLKAPQMQCSNPANRLSIQAKDARINFSSVSRHLTFTQITGEGLQFSMQMDQASMKMPNLTSDLSGITMSGKMKAPVVGGATDYGYPAWVDLKAKDSKLNFPGDTTHLRLRNLKLSADWDTLRSGSGTLHIATSGDALQLKSPKSTFDLHKFEIALASRPGKHAGVSGKPIPQPSNRWLDTICHHDPYLFVSPPKALMNILDNYHLSLSVKAADGIFLNKAYPARNYLTGVDLEANCDSIVLHKVAVASQNTRFTLSGTLTNLLPWLHKNPHIPLKASLNLAVDTLNFNQIAHTYQQGQHYIGKPTAPPKQAVLSHEDTITLMIPRNLDLEVRASAKATEYTNLNMYDLSTALRCHDGDILLDSLRIHASFGKALMSIRYCTHDIENITLWASMDLQDIYVVKFFEKYHTLLEMMPEMKNLSGVINVGGTASINVFPNMYLDLNSLQARVWASGNDLMVHQNKFIRHVTKMMLIPYGGDLKIKNIYATADVHDNLLELHPFDVEFFKYKIQMMGINDFEGHLNYHIAVLHMPIPFLKFGINVRGDYSKPKIWFGRHYDVRNTQERMVIYDSKEMNLLSEVHYFLKKFIHNAATSVSPEK